jgi:hypothetical protein
MLIFAYQAAVRCRIDAECGISGGPEFLHALGRVRPRETLAKFGKVK